MNVKELREYLEGLPDDLPVTVDGYEGGITEHLVIDQMTVACDVHGEDYYGEHASLEGYVRRPGTTYETKVVLNFGRESAHF